MALIQLKKLVAGLKASLEIQYHKLCVIQSENSYFKEKREELNEDNEHLEGKIQDLLDETGNKRKSTFN